MGEGERGGKERVRKRMKGMVRRGYGGGGGEKGKREEESGGE